MGARLVLVPTRPTLYGVFAIRSCLGLRLLTAVPTGTTHLEPLSRIICRRLRYLPGCCT